MTAEEASDVALVAARLSLVGNPDLHFNRAQALVFVGAYKAAARDYTAAAALDPVRVVGRTSVDVVQWEGVRLCEGRVDG